MKTGNIYICNVNFLSSFTEGYKYVVDSVNGNLIHLLCINDDSDITINRAVFTSRIKRKHFTAIK